MELFKLVCPSCGADISLEKETSDCFCPYCGTKFKFDDGIKRSEHTVYYRDEAKLRELELKEEARIRNEQERLKEEKKKEAAALRKKKAFKRWYIIVGIWGGLFILYMLGIYLLERVSPGVVSSDDSSDAWIPIFLILFFIPFVLPILYPFKYSTQTKLAVWIKWACGLFLASLVLLKISTVLEPESMKIGVYPTEISDDFVKSAKEAPVEVYNSPASENHLGGLHCYVEGKVLTKDSTTDANGYVIDYIILGTENGEIAVSDADSYGMKVLEANKEVDDVTYNLLHKMYEESNSRGLPSVGSQVKIYCVYIGFSDVLDKPSFYYGYPVSIQLEESPKK